MNPVAQKQKGAVSLFLVIFSALLITTVTVAFIRIMIQDQVQATTNDLSRSALDSAQAGVEDAKRAIVTYLAHCANSGDASGTQECVDLTRALTDGDHCDTLQRAGIVGEPAPADQGGGWIVKQSENDAQLQQAYTCVKVQLNTVDYLGSLTPNTSRLIPLKSSEPFDQVKIEWYSQKDLQNGLSDGTSPDSKVDLGLDSSLPKLADWPNNRPALLRVQLLQFGDSFMLSDFDKNKDDQTNNASLFLMPSSVGSDNISFADDVRQSHTSGALEQIRCHQDFSIASTNYQYACSVTIKLPNPINSDSGDNRHAYLRINEFYNPNTTFRVCLDSCDDNNPVLFSGVQPIVDSTGRANDMFRRIRSRIELSGSSIPNVEAAVDITGNFCKTFRVTDQAVDYDPGSCPNGFSSN